MDADVDHQWIWILTAFGLTEIVATSKIIEPLRSICDRLTLTKPIADLMRCSMCSGFWVGIVLHLVGYPMTDNPITDGGLASGASWSLHSFASSLESIATKNGIEIKNGNSKKEKEKEKEKGESAL